jgi:hypothetical protein
MFAEKADADTRYWVFVELAVWTGVCQMSFMFRDVTSSSAKPGKHKETKVLRCLC